MWMSERVHRSGAAPRVMSEVAATLEASGYAPWFKAEGASDGLGLEGDELQRYKSGVTKTVHAIVIKETDAIAQQLDELLKEQIAIESEHLTARLINAVEPRVQKAVALKAAELQAIMEADHQRTQQAVEQMDQKLHEGLDMAKKEITMETGLLMKKHQKQTEAAIEKSESRLKMFVMAEVEEVAEEKVKEQLAGPLKDRTPTGNPQPSLISREVSDRSRVCLYSCFDGREAGR